MHMNRKTAHFSVLMGGVILILSLSAQLDAQEISRMSGISAAAERIAPNYPVIRSKKMKINYQIDHSMELSRVELWYAHGLDGSWQLYDYDLDMKSPIVYTAQNEGLYRFLVVAVDQWGRRSYASGNQAQAYSTSLIPPVDTQSHQIVFIDYTPPKLYLYNPRAELVLQQGDSVKVRWRGFDANLPERPVKVYFRKDGIKQWIQIGESLPVQGDFNWTFPSRLSGSIQLKVALQDSAGNLDVQYSGRIFIQPTKTTSEVIPSVAPKVEKPVQLDHEIFKSQLPDTTPTILQVPKVKKEVIPEFVSLEKVKQAKDAFRRGCLHSQREEWLLAIKAYHESISLDPEAVEPRVNLANVYFRTGKFEKALEHFEVVLQKQPKRTNALFGLAQTQMALNQHEKALASLDKLLKQDRKDWQAWQMQAEAAKQIGDLALAKSSWETVANSNYLPVRRMAQKQLELLGQ